LSGWNCALAWEAKAGSRVETVDGRGAHPFEPLDAGAQRRLVFAQQLVGVAARRQEEIAVEALEVAVDLLVRDDGADRLDGGGVALRGEPRAVGAVQPLDLVVAIVQRGGEVGGRGRGHAAADGPMVQNDYALPFLGEKVGARHARDAGADDAGVGSRIRVERLARREGSTTSRASGCGRVIA
jgi:hypothetical protein